MNIEDKLQKIGKVTLCASIGDHKSFKEHLKLSDSGIFLFNEVAMINPERVDSPYGGIKRESVNLEKMTGNFYAVDLIIDMKLKENCTFFPGIVLRDFGGYSLCTMPIIKNGKIILERIKQTGIPEVYDYPELARKFLGKEFVEPIRNHNGLMSTEPMNSLFKKIDLEVKKKRNNFPSLEMNELTVVPVLCNELSTMCDYYNGKPFDAVFHSSTHLYNSSEERKESYSKVFGELALKGFVKKPLIIFSVEDTVLEGIYKGVFAYDQGKLSEIPENKLKSRY